MLPGFGSICTLIFDADPLELGRAKSDTTICYICEEHIMYIIELKRITTMTVVITLDETEVAALIVEPTPLINDLRSLNRSWTTPEPKTAKRQPSIAKPATVKATKHKKGKPIINCKFCKAPFINPGSRDKHEARCIDNPDRAIEVGD